MANRASRTRAGGPSKHEIMKVFDDLVVATSRVKYDRRHRSFRQFNASLLSAYAAWMEGEGKTSGSFPMSQDRLFFIALMWWRHIIKGQLLSTDHPDVQPLKRLLLSANRIRQDGEMNRKEN